MPKLVFKEKEVADYLEKMVKFWRGKKNDTEVPFELEKAFGDVTGDQQLAFAARFYVDAFQSVHTSLFDELVPADV